MPCVRRLGRGPLRFVLNRFGAGGLAPGGVSPAKLVLELREDVREPLRVGIEAGQRNLDGLPAGEFLQAVRKLAGLRHRRPVDKDRNDRNVALQRRLDFDADEVVRVVEATTVLTVGARDPVLADDGQERVALADPVGKHVDEITPGRDRVDVEKDVLPSEAARQPIVDPPGVSARVFPSIADEDAAQHPMSPR